MLRHSAVLKYSSISPYLPTQIFALVFEASIVGACAAPNARHDSADRHNTTSAQCRWRIMALSPCGRIAGLAGGVLDEFSRNPNFCIVPCGLPSESASSIPCAMSCFGMVARRRFRPRRFDCWRSSSIAGRRRSRKASFSTVSGRRRPSQTRVCTTWWPRCAPRLATLRRPRGSSEPFRDSVMPSMGMRGPHPRLPPMSSSGPSRARASFRVAEIGDSPKVRMTLAAIGTARSASILPASRAGTRASL